MARGTGFFNGTELRRQRLKRGLSAARLAEAVGTTKAMVLAYEAGKTVPEARRAAFLAEVLEVPADRLVRPPLGARTGSSRQRERLLAEELGTEVEVVRALTAPYEGQRPTPHLVPAPLTDLRRVAGLRVADVADRAGISISSYRSVETEGLLPSRGTGRFPAKLAEALGVRDTRVELALRHHPEAIKRALRVSESMGDLFSRMERTGEVVTSDDPAVQQVFLYVRQPLGILTRAMNVQLDRHRGLRRREAMLAASAAYPRPGDGGDAEEELQDVAAKLSTSPETSATRLMWSLSQALTARQWRAFADALWTVYSHPPGPRAVGAVHEFWPELGPALLYRRWAGRSLVNMEDSGAELSYRFTPAAVRFYDSQWSFYRAIYPRFSAPSPAYFRRKRTEERYLY
ncbi:helix-turn-helix domain-containing protein [Streptomyces virginiae]|uniref:helix-turn-helix domain-containing protein n=1 Tax=Streptomyces virginiae TaxID=1961 RepID=UPI003659569E